MPYVCKIGKNFSTCEKNKRNKFGCARCKDSEFREIGWADAERRRKLMEKIEQSD